mmetsp:Transcript_173935/g.557528  ORF Transcript_173935/g.557528 Transcript_173935/m.557528 type:complete len:395 (-) Transcript_173935:59-1243(-)
MGDWRTNAAVAGHLTCDGRGAAVARLSSSVSRALVALALLPRLVNANDLTAYWPAGRNSTPPEHHAWTNQHVRAVSDSLRPSVQSWRDAPFPNIDEEELRQALLWASYPVRISGVQVAVYANKKHENLQLLVETAPFPVTVLSQEGEWKGTLDKLLAYWMYLKAVDDDAIVIFCDAFDVFGNGIDGHELLRRYFAFERPIVLSTEENIFPREVQGQALMAVDVYGALGLGNISAPSRFVNAGGIMGMGWALKTMFNDMQENMVAHHPEFLMSHADRTGHWFLHAYDQYELWRFFIRHIFAVQEKRAKLLLGLDIEQLIFGSTVLRKDNWPSLLGEDVLGGVNGVHSIDVDVPLVFDAPQELWTIRRCSARFAGRRHSPVFWHGAAQAACRGSLQ